MGFRKEGNTFWRDRGGYIERFNFQGSSGSTWDETVFYLNAGVEFSDYEPATRNWVYFRNVHWADRIDELVPEAPPNWRCRPDTDRAALKRQLAELIQRASDEMACRNDELRAAYLARMARRSGARPNNATRS